MFCFKSIYNYSSTLHEFTLCPHSACPFSLKLLYHLSSTDSVAVSDLVLNSKDTNLHISWNNLGNPKCDITYAVNVIRNNESAHTVNVKTSSYNYTMLYVGCLNYDVKVTPRIQSGKTGASLVEVYMPRKKFVTFYNNLFIKIPF